MYFSPPNRKAWLRGCRRRGGETGIFTGMALTLHKSQLLDCSGVMQWWACSALMFVPSSADSRCETCERIVLLLLFAA